MAYVVSAVSRSPLKLTLVATIVTSGQDVVFWKTRTSAINQLESQPEEDLGLDPIDAEGCTWQNCNKAEAEEEAAAKAARTVLAQAWERVAKARRQGTPGSD